MKRLDVIEGFGNVVERIYVSDSEAKAVAKSIAVERGTTNMKEFFTSIVTFDGCGDVASRVNIEDVEVEDEEDKFDGVLPGDC